MKALLLFTSLTTSLNLWAQKLTMSHLSQMNEKHLRSLINAYIDFNKEIDKGFKYDKSDKKYSHLFRYLEFIQSVHADESKKMCFFGGWPSRIEGGYCRSPWKFKDDQDFKSIGGAYKGACGARDEFRCNPILFGVPDQTQLDALSSKEYEGNIQLNGQIVVNKGKVKNKFGYCIKTGNTFKNLTEKCDKASRFTRKDVIENLKKDPDKKKEFMQYAGKVLAFCAVEEIIETKFKKDPCETLKKRVVDIINKINKPENTQVQPVPTPPAPMPTPPIPMPIVKPLNELEKYCREKFDQNEIEIPLCIDKPGSTNIPNFFYDFLSDMDVIFAMTSVRKKIFEQEIQEMLPFSTVYDDLTSNIQVEDESQQAAIDKKIVDMEAQRVNMNPDTVLNDIKERINNFISNVENQCKKQDGISRSRDEDKKYFEEILKNNLAEYAPITESDEFRSKVLQNYSSIEQICSAVRPSTWKLDRSTSNLLPTDSIKRIFLARLSQETLKKSFKEVVAKKKYTVKELFLQKNSLVIPSEGSFKNKLLKTKLDFYINKYPDELLAYLKDKSNIKLTSKVCLRIYPKPCSMTVEVNDQWRSPLPKLEDSWENFINPTPLIPVRRE